MEDFNPLLSLSFQEVMLAIYGDRESRGGGGKFLDP